MCRRFLYPRKPLFTKGEVSFFTSIQDKGTFLLRKDPYESSSFGTAILFIREQQQCHSSSWGELNHPFSA